MPSVKEFFLSEANECLDRMDAVLDDADDRDVDLAALHAACRALRGSAQMAREDEVHRLAFAMESTTKALAQQRLDWGEHLRVQLQQAVSQVRSVLAGEQAAPPAPDVAPAGDGNTIVPIESLLYRGRAALTRALQLQPALEAAIPADSPEAELLHELFDLIRLGSE